MSDMNNIIIFVVIFLAGGILGFVIYHFILGKKGSGKQQKELEQSKAELEQYKSRVNDHFRDSANLMGQVASSYQALHNHMASDSVSLLNDNGNTLFPLLDTLPQENQDKPELSESPALEPKPEDKLQEKKATEADDSDQVKDNGEHPQDNGEHSQDSGEHSQDSGEHSQDSGDQVKDSGEQAEDRVDHVKTSGKQAKDSLGKDTTQAG